ncbi:hypothetical protein EV13_1854 [Prochlorococcus sp. MIT 0702]|nr:hypothetical protein EV13_1854 [Prochlorococcus sp. MIT 0702]KGG29617.1 hypothetical protein EV12_0026 [Prochlorococcus sp. MIT 0701]KGG34384.1 hypothetical protein EV14_1280 [Prochlorococcus sp. MIT 0703]
MHLRVFIRLFKPAGFAFESQTTHLNDTKGLGPKSFGPFVFERCDGGFVEIVLISLQKPCVPSHS